ncbi:hypothetical protein EKL30_08535 [Candidimonas sp. SYP-B2681]|uniref:hypothetical protein n=1 Tax=Candidimonas sp. SYP-B2681 TaxID=2497686 RepID=UPI000F8667D5|nr:hypothetical protein [Candidimonas sp. SYP-B2681]RTZ44602.1 hypothetical protein EKL30_08535 [Candidimonas sp. SYP-B2681]
MKTLNKALVIAALLAAPFAGAQAARDQAAHEAWIKAQKIDIQPTLRVTETEIPADSSATGSQMPGTSSQPGSTSSGAANSTGTGLVPPSSPPAQSAPYPGTGSTMPGGTAPFPVHPGGQKQ